MRFSAYIGLHPTSSTSSSSHANPSMRQPSQRLAPHRLRIDDDLDAAIAGAAGVGAVRDDRVAAAVADDKELLRLACRRRGSARRRRPSPGRRPDADRSDTAARSSGCRRCALRCRSVAADSSARGRPRSLRSSASAPSLSCAVPKLNSWSPGNSMRITSPSCRTLMPGMLVIVRLRSKLLFARISAWLRVCTTGGQRRRAVAKLVVVGLHATPADRSCRAAAFASPAICSSQQLRLLPRLGQHRLQLLIVAIERGGPLLILLRLLGQRRLLLRRERDRRLLRRAARTAYLPIAARQRRMPRAPAQRSRSRRK